MHRKLDTRVETKSPPIRLVGVASRFEALARITLVLVRNGCLLSLAPLVFVINATIIARSGATALA